MLDFQLKFGVFLRIWNTDFFLILTRTVQKVETALACTVAVIPRHNLLYFNRDNFTCEFRNLRPIYSLITETVQIRN